MHWRRSNARLVKRHMNNQLYDALEICLHALKNGASIDSVLARYPEQASKLRPILEASQRAREITVPRPSADVLRRRRAQLLQRASEMREARRKPAWRQSVIPFFQRLAFALTMAVVFLMSGTGLVQASSSALPGEDLYPVKRTWEDVRLLFVFTPGIREAISGQYEQERLDEVSELLREGRVVSITFTGLVTADQDGNLLVSGVPVAVTSKTEYLGDQLAPGTAVTVTGQTDSVGHVTAMSLQVLPSGAFVPTGEPAEEGDLEIGYLPSPNTGSGNGNSSSSNQNESPERPQDNAPVIRSGSFHIEGTVQSVQGNVWTIDGQTIYMDNVSIQGNVTVGSRVEVKGYFTTDGRFLATRIEVKRPSNHGEGKNNNGNDNEDDSASVNVNQNDNENSNDNVNSNENDNENDNENHNGDDNENHNSNDNWNSNYNSNYNGNDNHNDD